MSTAASPLSAALTAEYVNPVIRATRDVFEMMLGCPAKRVGLKVVDQDSPRHAVSGVIGITGKAVGTIVLCMSEQMALAILKQMVGTEVEKVNHEVCDAVGELTNMVAGAAKAQMAHLELSISLPNVISGDHHFVHFPADIKPFCILFESDLGPFNIEVAFSAVRP
jgi:chemotaxis protein CheX